ncbi:hypothetical protein Enr13x_00960 [Stieleria neptunia]|uniref:Uncharacterized protein n=1 Tax=Stieleria neptunia TaxID=2527979 RepID=A0A518HHJ3_9BACT|nr:hypothetical protein Enr13x_00960 [Stieleria neptunia]
MRLSSCGAIKRDAIECISVTVCSAGSQVMDGKKERMLCQCPNGHRLRGDAALIGKTIRCPRCRETFVFGYAIWETLSDAAILKILAEAPTRVGERATV